MFMDKLSKKPMVIYVQKKVDIVESRNYNAGLTETGRKKKKSFRYSLFYLFPMLLGGGPLGMNAVLSPLFQKYYEQILGLDNPAVAATAIPV